MTTDLTTEIEVCVCCGIEVTEEDRPFLGYPCDSCGSIGWVPVPRGEWEVSHREEWGIDGEPYREKARRMRPALRRMKAIEAERSAARKEAADAWDAAGGAARLATARAEVVELYAYENQRAENNH